MSWALVSTALPFKMVQAAFIKGILKSVVDWAVNQILIPAVDVLLKAAGKALNWALEPILGWLLEPFVELTLYTPAPRWHSEGDLFDPAAILGKPVNEPWATIYPFDNSFIIGVALLVLAVAWMASTALSTVGFSSKRGAAERETNLLVGLVAIPLSWYPVAIALRFIELLTHLIGPDPSTNVTSDILMGASAEGQVLGATIVYFLGLGLYAIAIITQVFRIVGTMILVFGLPIFLAVKWSQIPGYSDIAGKFIGLIPKLTAVPVISAIAFRFNFIVLDGSKSGLAVEDMDGWANVLINPLIHMTPAVIAIIIPVVFVRSMDITPRPSSYAFGGATRDNTTVAKGYDALKGNAKSTLGAAGSAAAVTGYNKVQEWRFKGPDSDSDSGGGLPDTPDDSGGWGSGNYRATDGGLDQDGGTSTRRDSSSQSGSRNRRYSSASASARRSSEEPEYRNIMDVKRAYREGDITASEAGSEIQNIFDQRQQQDWGTEFERASKEYETVNDVRQDLKNGNISPAGAGIAVTGVVAESDKTFENYTDEEGQQRVESIRQQLEDNEISISEAGARIGGEVLGDHFASHADYVGSDTGRSIPTETSVDDPDVVAGESGEARTTGRSGYDLGSSSETGQSRGGEMEDDAPTAAELADQFDEYRDLADARDSGEITNDQFQDVMEVWSEGGPSGSDSGSDSAGSTVGSESPGSGRGRSRPSRSRERGGSRRSTPSGRSQLTESDNSNSDMNTQSARDSIDNDQISDSGIKKPDFDTDIESFRGED